MRLKFSSEISLPYLPTPGVLSPKFAHDLSSVNRKDIRVDSFRPVMISLAGDRGLPDSVTLPFFASTTKGTLPYGLTLPGTFR